MTLIDCIRKKYTEKLSRGCSEGKCNLVLQGFTNVIVLKGEKICNDRKICDCIIFIIDDNKLAISLVELKTRNASADDIEEKLRNGSEIASNVLHICGFGDTALDRYHLVLCTNWRSSEHRIIRSRFINFKGKKYPLIPKKCGASLSELIENLT